MDKRCKCGQSITHTRVYMCDGCYLEYRKISWKENEAKRLEADPSRRLALAKKNRDRYFSRYREARLNKKVCSCGNQSLKGAINSKCLECSKKSRSVSKIKYQTNRKKMHLSTKIRENIKSRLKKSFGSKTHSIVKYLGCTIEEFKNYLESKFQEGMSWDNYGKEWHIDHIIPLSTNYNDLDLHNYMNTQPLWKHEHIKKTAIENGQKMPSTTKVLS